MVPPVEGTSSLRSPSSLRQGLLADFRLGEGECLWSGVKKLKELAAASFHAGSAGAGEAFDEWGDFGAKFVVGGAVNSDVDQGLHGEGFDDAAFVGEVVVEDGEGFGLFGRSEREAREKLGCMPAELFALHGRGGIEDQSFPGLEEFWVLASDFFDGVCAAHADKGIRIEKAGNEFREEFWIFGDLAGDLVGFADGAAVAAFESGENAGH